MVDYGQTNIRIPEKAKPIVHRLARLLREDPNFLYNLSRFVEETSSERASFIADRVERLEAKVAELEARLGPSDAAPSLPPSTAWTEGEGKGRRLTPEGAAELRRLIEDGASDREISDVLGVRPFSVARQRKRISAG